MRPRIAITYSTFTPESAEDGDIADSGWIDEDPSPLEPDEEEGETVVSLAVKELQDAGATQASSSHFHEGVWYTSEGDTDYRTGETTEKSYHLKDFTPGQELEIFQLVTGVQSKPRGTPTVADLREFIANPCVFPGGYTKALYTHDGERLCPECTEKHLDQIIDELAYPCDPQWRPLVIDYYWEGPVVQCSHCNKDLPSEYGDPNALPNGWVATPDGNEDDFTHSASGWQTFKSKADGKWLVWDENFQELDMRPDKRGEAFKLIEAEWANRQDRKEQPHWVPLGCTGIRKGWQLGPIDHTTPCEIHPHADIRKEQP